MSKDNWAPTPATMKVLLMVPEAEHLRALVLASLETEYFTGMADGARESMNLNKGRMR